MSGKALALRLSVIGVTALGGVLFGVDTAAGDTVLASGLPQAPKVSANGQALAWSEYDRSASDWRLVVLRNGITQVLPIAPSPVPFDVDLGEDSRGRLVAAYSRCSKPAAVKLPPGCRLFAFDFATGSERALAVANAPGASQFLPAISNGSVAFVRVATGRPVGPGNPQRIYIQRLAGGKPVLMRGGMQNAHTPGSVTGLDLNIGLLAFTWHGTDGDVYPNGTSELRVDGIGGGIVPPQTLVSIQGQSEISSTEVLGPTLLGDTVAYAVSSAGDETFAEFRTFGLPGAGAHRATAVAPEGLQSVASDAVETIYSRCLPPTIAPAPLGRACEVALAPALRYRDVDPVIGTTARPSTISSYRGNWIAFSAYDPANHVYRLMLRHPNGSIVPAPVAPRPVPFDVQLGPIYGGRELSLRTALAAVYSRCRVEPLLEANTRLPLPWTGHECTLYRYYLGSSHEEAIAGTGSRYLPSVWDGRLAFARQEPGGGSGIYVQSLRGHGAPRRVPGGPGSSGAGPRSIVLHERRLALVWEYHSAGRLHSQLRLDGPGGKVRVLDSVSSTSGKSHELSPSFTAAGVLAWARHENFERSWLRVLGLSGQSVFSYLLPNPTETMAATQLSGSRVQLNGTIYYGLGGQGTMSIMRLASSPAVVTAP